MKIYGVRIGCDYEGGNVGSQLFKLKSDALMEAHAIAYKYNHDNDCNYSLMPNGLVYRDEYDYIEVCEFELI